MFEQLKNNFIRWIFFKNRRQLEDLFIEDVFGDIPHDLTENSMKFLLSGGQNFDKWMRIASFSLQRKMQQPLKEGSGAYIGGLVFFKTLNVMMSRLEHGKPMVSPENVPISDLEKTLEESLKGVDEFANDEFFKRSK